MQDATEAATADLLLGGRLTLLQPRRGYRVAVDPLLLAAAVAPGEREHVLDAGAGTGAVALALATRAGGCRISALERDPTLAALARRSVPLNGLADRVQVFEGDIADPPQPVRGVLFDHVATNPPYLSARIAGSCGGARDGAHVEAIPLATWIGACLRRLRPRGTLTLIHRADRLGDILIALDGVAGAATILPVRPHAGAPARRVIVAARKSVRGGTRLLAGLALHARGGGYTPEAEAVLRDAAALSLSLA